MSAFPWSAGNKPSYIYKPNGSQWFVIGSTSADPVVLEGYIGLGSSRWSVPQSVFAESFVAQNSANAFGSIIKSLTSDYSNSTTTYTDISAFDVDLVDGTAYLFDCHIITDNTAGSSDLQLVVAGSPVIYGKGLGATTDGIMGRRNGAYSSASPVRLEALDNNVTDGCIHVLQAYVVPDSDVTAHIQARDRGGGSTAIVKAGSFVRVTVV